MIELGSDASLARDLAAGGVFVPGCTLRMSEECELVVCGARGRISVPARVVYVDEHRGAGLELIGFSTEMREQLAELAPIDEDDLAVPVASVPGDDDRTIPVATGVHGAIPPDDDLAVPIAPDDDDDHLTTPVAMVFPPDDGPAHAPPAASGDLPVRSDPAIAIAEADAAFGGAADGGSAPQAGGEGSFEVADAELDAAIAEAEAEADLATEPAGVDGAGERRGEVRPPRNVHERLGGLPLAAQLKLAAGGELHERIVLERLYGKNVWETLLRNPRLTPPEVSRIARYGALPRVLLEIILANNAWLAAPEVRRALLSNPRVPADQVMKILRLVPRHELRLAAIQTAYPQAVRSAAKLLLGGE